MRTFTFTDDTSNKFWNIELKGKSFVVQFGRIGTAGQTQTKDFPDAEKAKKAYEKLIAEKVGKGYVETTKGGASKAKKDDEPVATTAAPITPVQQMLEKALYENPNDLASHSAYADCLMEQNDPRGELIQVQLALEDESKSASERKTLKASEKKLLTKLRKSIVGKLAPVMDGDWCAPGKPFHYEIQRGWVTFFRTLPFPDGIISMLANSPEMRMLQRLEIIYDMEFHPWDFDSVTAGPKKALKNLDADGDDDDDDDEGYDSDMYGNNAIMLPLVASTYLTQLRSFKLGFSDKDDDYAMSTMVDPFGGCTAKNVLKFIEKNPYLEELYINASLGDIKTIFAYEGFTNLKVLQYYYGSDYYGSQRKTPYPLGVLADNDSLKNITTLRFHPGRDAELDLKEVKKLLNATNLPKLTHLQLHMSTYGDELVKPLIDSKIMQRLKVLDIGYGNLSDEGARQLATCPDLKKLELLDISRNALTTRGIAYLKATGVQLVGDKEQHDPEETDYLYEVDRE